MYIFIIFEIFFFKCCSEYALGYRGPDFGFASQKCASQCCAEKWQANKASWEAICSILL